jgi:hypothetical protein
MPQMTQDATVGEGGLAALRGMHLRYDIFAPNLAPTGEFVWEPLLEDQRDGKGLQMVSFGTEAEAVAYVEDDEDLFDAIVVRETKRLYRRSKRMENANITIDPKNVVFGSLRVKPTPTPAPVATTVEVDLFGADGRRVFDLALANLAI